MPTQGHLGNHWGAQEADTRVMGAFGAWPLLWSLGEREGRAA